MVYWGVANVVFLCQLENPDMRVVIIKDFVQSNFPATPLLNYALEVEKITTSKVCTIMHYFEFELSCWMGLEPTTLCSLGRMLLHTELAGVCMGCAFCMN